MIKAVQVRAIDIDARVPLRIDITLAAIDGQIGRPAQAEPAAVVLVRVDDAVAVDIAAVEQLRRHTLDQEQFVQRIERGILGVIRRAQAAVIFVLGPARARVGVGIDVVDDGIGDLLSHVRQTDQDVVQDGAARVQQHEGVDVDLAGFVGDSVAIALAAAARVVRVNGGNDAEPPLQAWIIVGLNDAALENLVAERIAVQDVAEGVGIAEQGSGLVDAGLGQGLRLC